MWVIKALGTIMKPLVSTPFLLKKRLTVCCCIFQQAGTTRLLRIHSQIQLGVTLWAELSSPGAPSVCVAMETSKSATRSPSYATKYRLSLSKSCTEEGRKSFTPLKMSSSVWGKHTEVIISFSLGNISICEKSSNVSHAFYRIVTCWNEWCCYLSVEWLCELRKYILVFRAR